MADANRDRILVATADAPQKYQSTPEAQAAWPFILQDCARLVTAVEEANIPHDTTFVRLHVGRTMLHRPVVQIDPFAKGWTLSSTRTAADSRFGERFRYVDGQRLLPDTVNEERLILTDKADLFYLRSRVVPAQSTEPFGVLTIPVKDLRGGHEEDDEKRLSKYINSHENDFVKASTVTDQVHSEGLIFAGLDGGVNTRYDEFSRANLSLQSLRQFVDKHFPA